MPTGIKVSRNTRRVFRVYFVVATVAKKVYKDSSRFCWPISQTDFSHSQISKKRVNSLTFMKLLKK